MDKNFDFKIIEALHLDPDNLRDFWERDGFLTQADLEKSFRERIFRINSMSFYHKVCEWIAIMEEAYIEKSLPPGPVPPPPTPPPVPPPPLPPPTPPYVPPPYVPPGPIPPFTPPVPPGPTPPFVPPGPGPGPIPPSPYPPPSPMPTPVYGKVYPDIYVTDGWFIYSIYSSSSFDYGYAIVSGYFHPFRAELPETDPLRNIVKVNGIEINPKIIPNELLVLTEELSLIRIRKFTLNGVPIEFSPGVYYKDLDLTYDSKSYNDPNVSGLRFVNGFPTYKIPNFFATYSPNFDCVIPISLDFTEIYHPFFPKECEDFNPIEVIEAIEPPTGFEGLKVKLVPTHCHIEPDFMSQQIFYNGLKTKSYISFSCRNSPGSSSSKITNTIYYVMAEEDEELEVTPFGNPGFNEGIFVEYKSSYNGNMPISLDWKEDYEDGYPNFSPTPISFDLKTFEGTGCSLNLGNLNGYPIVFYDIDRRLRYDVDCSLSGVMHMSDRSHDFWDEDNHMSIWSWSYEFQWGFFWLQCFIRSRLLISPCGYSNEQILNCLNEMFCKMNSKILGINPPVFESGLVEKIIIETGESPINTKFPPPRGDPKRSEYYENFQNFPTYDVIGEIPAGRQSYPPDVVYLTTTDQKAIEPLGPDLKYTIYPVDDNPPYPPYYLGYWQLHWNAFIPKIFQFVWIRPYKVPPGLISGITNPFIREVSNGFYLYYYDPRYSSTTPIQIKATHIAVHSNSFSLGGEN